MNTKKFKHGYALLIGVGDDLPESVRDVKSIHNILVDENIAAYPTSQVQILTEEKATRANILNALYQLKQQTKHDAEATVFIYYSGHGGQPKGSFWDDYYLCPNDYMKSENRRKRLMGKDWVKGINAIKAKKMIVTLDCCHAQGIASKSEPIEKGNSALMQKLEGGEGRVILASCKDDEKSYAINGKLSIFTEAFLEAMKGISSKPQEQYVAVIDIIQHVLKEVPRKAENFSRVQTPMASKIENLDADFVLCRHNEVVSKEVKEKAEKTSEEKTKGNKPIDKDALQKLFVRNRFPKIFDILSKGAGDMMLKKEIAGLERRWNKNEKAVLMSRKTRGEYDVEYNAISTILLNLIMEWE